MKYLILLLLSLFQVPISAQTCDEMYFETLEADATEIAQEIAYQGVRLLSYSGKSQKCDYMIAMASTPVSAGKSESIMSRITSVKLKREALLFVQGSTVTSETIFETQQEITNNDVEYYELMIDKISENSNGFVDGMKSLKSFKTNEGKVFVNIKYSEI